MSIDQFLLWLYGFEHIEQVTLIGAVYVLIAFIALVLIVGLAPAAYQPVTFWVASWFFLFSLVLATVFVLGSYVFVPHTTNLTSGFVLFVMSLAFFLMFTGTDVLSQRFPPEPAKIDELELRRQRRVVLGYYVVNLRNETLRTLRQGRRSNDMLASRRLLP